MLPALIAEHADAIDRLCRDHNVRRLEVFGSAVTGQWDPQRSDLDFIVDFEGTVGLKALVHLQESLVQIFGRKVDLITDHEYDNPYFRRSVEASRTHLWGEPRNSPPANGAYVSEHPALKHLWDLQQEIGKLERRTDSLSFAEWFDDLDRRDLVRLGLIDIGEILNGLSDRDSSSFERITGAAGFIGLRNVIAHQYRRVNWHRVWDTVQNEVPLLHAEVEALIAELELQDRD